MKTIKRTLIYALTVALLISAAAFTATSAFAADAKTYDVSEVVSVVGAHKEYEMKHGVKVAGKENSNTAIPLSSPIRKEASLTTTGTIRERRSA